MKLIHSLPVLAALAAALVLITEPAAVAASGPGVAWRAPVATEDIDRYFAQAKSQNKPLLLYWGAKWCPPCNQLKATLFNRADFIAQSDAYLAVNIDGDAPGAQKIGARFKVGGYPTMILFKPDGTEISRLNGEMDPAQVMGVLQLGLSSGRSVADVLAGALAGQALSANEWRLVGVHDWLNDDALATGADRAPALARLAQASEKAGQAETATRLWLKSLAASEKGAAVDARPLARLQAVLKDPVQTRAQMAVLVSQAPSLVDAVAPQGDGARGPLVADFDGALKQLGQDQRLSRIDRLDVLAGRVELAQLDADRKGGRPPLPASLLAEVRQQTGQIDRDTTDPYERQAVVSSAAYVLSRANLWSESDELLKAGLARSHSAYYLMSQLGGNAMKQGRKTEALRWYEQAFNKSEGAATRLQWGSSYLSVLVDVNPGDTVRIERTATQLINEAGKDPGAFYERSEASMKRVARVLTRWNRGPTQAAAVGRLRSRLDGVCAKLGAQDAKAKASCEGLMQPAKTKA